MKIAVTGANGFIASHIIKELVNHKEEDGQYPTVVACVRTDTPEKTGHLRAIGKDAGGTVEIVSGCDMSNDGSYDDAFKGCDIVIHVAAVVDISGKNPDAVIQAALDGTKNVVQSVQKNTETVQRFLFTSSVAAVFSAYGLADDHIYTEKDWNDWSTRTTDPYGYGKTQAEKYIWEQLYSDTNKKLDVVVMNPSVVLGPCLTKQHTKSSTSVVREIIYGNRMNEFTTSFVDVRDVAKAHVLACYIKEAIGKRFIVSGDEKPMKTTDLATVAQPLFPNLTLVGKPTLYLSYGIYTLLKYTGMIVPYQVANIERKFQFSNQSSKDILGMKYHTLEETLKDTIDSMITPQDPESTKGWVQPKLR